MTVPLNPKELGRWHTAKPEARPPHRNAYQGSHTLPLTANVKGYDRDLYVSPDISNPAKLFAVSRFPVAAAHSRGFIFCVTPDRSRINDWQAGGAPIEAARRTATNTDKRSRHFSFLPQN